MSARQILTYLVIIIFLYAAYDLGRRSHNTQQQQQQQQATQRQKRTEIRQQRQKQQEPCPPLQFEIPHQYSDKSPRREACNDCFPTKRFCFPIDNSNFCSSSLSSSSSSKDDVASPFLLIVINSGIDPNGRIKREAIREESRHNENAKNVAFFIGNISSHETFCDDLWIMINYIKFFFGKQTN